MKFIIKALFLTTFSVSVVYSQKGIDTQSRTIRDENNKTTSRTNDATRSFDWGKGKTQVRERLANPYRLNSRREMLIENIKLALEERKMIVDEASSRISEGLIVTQPFTLARGPVIAQRELKRYAILEFNDNAWSQAKVSLTIEVLPIDAIQNNVAVSAKIEGRGGSGLRSEWITLSSSGLAEEEFLVKLIEIVTGISPDEP